MEIVSSNSGLTELMAWAQCKAASFVVTGQSGPVNRGNGGKWYGPSLRFFNRSHAIRRPNRPWARPKAYLPSYWAGYHDRTAFYIRDFVHQAMGAEYLGYHEENYQMMRCFVEGACADTGWYAPWALNFDGSIYYMDTPNRRRFVRELTAQYELVETLCKLYFHSGDSRYLERQMRAFAGRILGEFTARHDGMVFPVQNGVPEGRGNIWRGSASYNESGTWLAEAGDSIAALYQALRSYAGLLEAQGSAAEAAAYAQRAQALKAYFNDVWSIPPEGGGYVFGVDRKGRKYWRWVKTAKGITGAETCFFMPMKLLTEPGERNDRLLDEIHHMAGDPETAMNNIESYTYLPQVFFPYHQPERAWSWMKYIGARRFEPHICRSQGLNEDYPELSFTMIACAVEGLAGFSANAQAGQVSTCPCMPQEVPDLSIGSLRAGDCSMDLHIAAHDTVMLTNHSTRPLWWKCAFAGRYDRLLIGEEAAVGRCKMVNGVPRSFVEVEVPPGAAVQIHAAGRRG